MVGLHPRPLAVSFNEKPHLTFTHHANSSSFLSSRTEVTSSMKPSTRLPVLSMRLCFQSSLHCGLQSAFLTLANSR